MAFVSTAVVAKTVGSFKVWSLAADAADGPGPHEVTHNLGYTPTLVQVSHLTVGSFAEGLICVPKGGSETTVMNVTRVAAIPANPLSCELGLGRTYGVAR